MHKDERKGIEKYSFGASGNIRDLENVPQIYTYKRRRRNINVLSMVVE